MRAAGGENPTRSRGIAAAGFAACALVAGALVASCGERAGDAGGGAPGRRPNLLLVVVDTLRKDHLHLYGYPRRTCDHLDTLARRGWIFENHMAPASQTVPSMLTLMLSLYPAEHGFPHREDRQFLEQRPVYPERLRFLAEAFRDAGYDTAAFVTNPFLDRPNGFAQGFQTFVHWNRRGRREAARIVDRAIPWLERHVVEGEGPFFCYLHFMDVHQPYDQPPEYLRRFAPPRGPAGAPEGAADHAPGRVLRGTGLTDGVRPEDLEATRGAYDAGIAWIDDQIGRVLDRIETLGLTGETVVAFTADHGEEFLDHGGLGHGTTVYGELVRVPLVIVDPEHPAEGRRIQRLTHYVDLAPTLLGLCGLPAEGSLAGRNLLEEEADHVFVDDGPWRCVMTPDLKLVRNVETGEEQLFALSDERDQKVVDPSGDAALEARLPALRGMLEAYEARSRATERASRAPGPDATAPKPPPKHWTEDELRVLEELGYVK